MAQLEQLTRGTVVKGILPDALVTVVDVQWHGDVAITLTYRDGAGRLPRGQAVGAHSGQGVAVGLQGQLAVRRRKPPGRGVAVGFQGQVTWRWERRSGSSSPICTCSP